MMQLQCVRWPFEVSVAPRGITLMQMHVVADGCMVHACIPEFVHPLPIKEAKSGQCK
jgi:hypothetical protein